MFVKICGVTTEEDALLAVAMGADAVGFNFVPSSSRQVAAGAVAQIVRRLPPQILTVGVFRDFLPQRVVEVVQQAGLRAAQLSGRESPEDCAYVADQVRFVIKAFSAGDPALLDQDAYRADVLMVDGPSPGSGQVFDWRLTERLPRSRPLLLAGGLKPENVGEAIRRVAPWGVDVATGVERSPGHKDASRVRAFVQAARAAAPAPYEPDETGSLYDWQEER